MTPPSPREALDELGGAIQATPEYRCLDRLLDWLSARIDVAIARHPAAWRWLEWDWLNRITARWWILWMIAAVGNALQP